MLKISPSSQPSLQDPFWSKHGQHQVSPTGPLAGEDPTTPRRRWTVLGGTACTPWLSSWSVWACPGSSSSHLGPSPGDGINISNHILMQTCLSNFVWCQTEPSRTLMKKNSLSPWSCRRAPGSCAERTRLDLTTASWSPSPGGWPPPAALHKPTQINVGAGSRRRISVACTNWFSVSSHSWGRREPQRGTTQRSVEGKDLPERKLASYLQVWLLEANVLPATLQDSQLL